MSVKSRVSARARAGRARRKPYSWLGVGALTVGVGLALTPGCGVAHADGAGAGGSSAADPRLGPAVTAVAGGVRRYRPRRLRMAWLVTLLVLGGRGVRVR